MKYASLIYAAEYVTQQTNAVVRWQEKISGKYPTGIPVCELQAPLEASERALDGAHKRLEAEILKAADLIKSNR